LVEHVERTSPTSSARDTAPTPEPSISLEVDSSEGPTKEVVQYNLSNTHDPSASLSNAEPVTPKAQHSLPSPELSLVVDEMNENRDVGSLTKDTPVENHAAVEASPPSAAAVATAAQSDSEVDNEIKFPTEPDSGSVQTDSGPGAQVDVSDPTVGTPFPGTDLSNSGVHSETDIQPKGVTLDIPAESRNRNESFASSKSPQAPGGWSSSPKALGRASVDVHAEGEFSSSRSKSHHLKDWAEKKKHAWKCLVM